jgi:hypothetical protein
MTTWWEGAAELRSACTGEDARAYTARANDEGRFYWPALGPKCISPSTSHEISQAKSHAPLRMTMWWEDPAELRSACTGEDARAYTARANDEERFYWPALGLKCISPSTSHEISQAKSHAPLRMTMWFGRSRRAALGLHGRGRPRLHGPCQRLGLHGRGRPRLHRLTDDQRRPATAGACVSRYNTVYYE